MTEKAMNVFATIIITLLLITSIGIAFLLTSLVWLGVMQVFGIIF